MDKVRLYRLFPLDVLQKEALNAFTISQVESSSLQVLGSLILGRDKLLAKAQTMESSTNPQALDTLDYGKHCAMLVPLESLEHPH